MTVYPLSLPAGRMIRLPRRQEVIAMLNRPAVFITAIVCGTVVALAFLAGVVYLVATGHPTEAVTGLLGGSLFGMVFSLRSKVNDIHTEVKQQAAATDASTP